MASSSSRTDYGMIKIDVNSAKLNTKIKGKFYVDVLVREGLKLRTNQVQSDTRTPSWNQKFVFSVPGDFIFNENSTVSFTLSKARKFLPDSLVGKATAQMTSLFLIEDYYFKEDDQEKDNATTCKYDNSGSDDDDDYDECCEHEDAKSEQPTENFGLKANVRLPILAKKSAVVGALNVAVTAWENHELSYLGKAKKSFPIYQGSDELGVLSTEAVAEKTSLSYVGDHVQWQNLAMDYDEFTMEKQIPPEPKKSPFWKLSKGIFRRGSKSYK